MHTLTLQRLRLLLSLCHYQYTLPPPVALFDERGGHLQHYTRPLAPRVLPVV